MLRVTGQQVPPHWAAEMFRWAKYSHKRLAGVCIVGGALRDIDHNLPYKDVDIFIQCEKAPEYEAMEVVAHPHYDEDKAAKVFKIRRCENRAQLERSLLRATRIRLRQWWKPTEDSQDFELVESGFKDHNVIAPTAAYLPLAEVCS